MTRIFSKRADVGSRSLWGVALFLLFGWSCQPTVGVYAQEAVEVVEVDAGEVMDDENEDDDEEVEVEAVAVANVFGMQPQKMMAAKRFQLKQLFLVEVEEIKRVCTLDKKQTLKLNIGSKGAVKRLTAAWKKASEGQMAQFGQQQPGQDKDDQPEAKEVEIKDADEIDENTMQMVMMNGMGNPFNYDDPRDSKFWRNTLKNVLNKEQLKEYRSYRKAKETAKRVAMVESSIVTMGIELGLAEDQKDEFATIVKPPMLKAKLKCYTFYEPYILYYYASKANKKKLKAILSPAQLQKWKIFVGPSKQIGQMMEMENGPNGGPAGGPAGEWRQLGEFLENVSEAIEQLLNFYSD